MQPIYASSLLLILAASLGALSVSSAELQERLRVPHWNEFKVLHNKKYADLAEEVMRRRIYAANVREIMRHNSEDGHSYKMGVSHLTDWTREEFLALNGHRVDKELLLTADIKLQGRQVLQKILANAKATIKEWPKEVDWRKADDVVTEVKDQGTCGSCWAFATTGVLEGQMKSAQANFTPLSEQNLMDCSTEQNKGCQGGVTLYALETIREEGGIQSERDYPYIGKGGRKCSFNVNKSIVSVSGGVGIVPCDEQELKELVAAYGPVAVSIVGGSDQFKHYASGVFDYPDCGDKTDHAVLLVGYGTDEKSGKDYWLVKNSWSDEWGEQGYVRMVRNKGAQCAITSLPTVPFFL